jgi:alpha-glucosidase
MQMELVICRELSANWIIYRILGFDAIWLYSIYPSPDVDFGYDVADYKGIDKKFGTMQDFDELLVKAHEKGIHISWTWC